MSGLKGNRFLCPKLWETIILTKSKYLRVRKKLKHCPSKSNESKDDITFSEDISQQSYK